MGEPYRTKQQAVCRECGTLFMLNPTQRARVNRDANSQVFCSRGCAGVESSKPLRCAHCGAWFDGAPLQRRRVANGGQAYCSRTCFHAARQTTLE